MIRGTFKNDESNGDFAGKSGWILYDLFTIDDEQRNYAIHIGNSEKIAGLFSFLGSGP